MLKYSNGQITVKCYVQTQIYSEISHSCRYQNLFYGDNCLIPKLTKQLVNSGLEIIFNAQGIKNYFQTASKA